jgi:hypothetical protein
MRGGAYDIECSRVAQVIPKRKDVYKNHTSSPRVRAVCDVPLGYNSFEHEEEQTPPLEVAVATEGSAPNAKDMRGSDDLVDMVSKQFVPK